MIIRLLQIAYAAARGRSARWPAARSAHLRKQPRCAACGGLLHLEVHHVVPVHVDPSRELDPDNLLTLCEAPGRWCHFRVGHSLSWSAWNDRAEEDAAHYLRRLNARLGD